MNISTFYCSKVYTISGTYNYCNVGGDEDDDCPKIFRSQYLSWYDAPLRTVTK